MKVEFYDYLMRPLEPISTLIVADITGQVETITTEESRQRIGTREGGALSALFQIVGNSMQITGEVVEATQPVTQIFRYEFTELNTSEKSYTSFRYIQ